MAKKEKVKKPIFKRVWFWVLVIFVVIIGANLGGNDDSASNATGTKVTEEKASAEVADKKEVNKEEKAAPAPKKEVKKEEPKMSVNQENAIRSAENYLDTMPFSKTGLIKQLKFDKYSNEDATFAVNNIKVNYKEQAAKAAQHYLDTMSFSKSALIDQLKFDGYTVDEATYGVSKVGLK